MRPIKYAEIVGTRMVETGKDGYYVNSTSYSVLVFYEDNTVELIEGDISTIKPYLKYMHPHCDNELINRLREQLIKDFERIIDVRLGKIYQLPDVMSKSYEEAKTILERTGFVVELKNPKESTKAQGIVIRCYRKEGTIRTAVIHLGYVIPDVYGRSVVDATQLLQREGFNVVLKKVCKKECEDGVVIGATYAEDNDNDVILMQNDLSDDGEATIENTFLLEIRHMTLMSEIYDLWSYYHLGEKYKNVDSYITMKKEFEVKNGKPKNMEEIREVISKMIQK